jgi:hypothetical protein
MEFGRDDDHFNWIVMHTRAPGTLNIEGRSGDLCYFAVQLWYSPVIGP